MAFLPTELITQEIAPHLPIEDRCLLLFVMKKPNNYGRINIQEIYEHPGVAPRQRLAYYKRIGGDSSFRDILEYLCDNNNFEKFDKEDCLTANDVDVGQFEVCHVRGNSEGTRIGLIKYAICGKADKILTEYHHLFYNTYGIVKHDNAWLSTGIIKSNSENHFIHAYPDEMLQFLIICIDYDQTEIFNKLYFLFGTYRRYDSLHGLWHHIVLLTKSSNKLIEWVRILLAKKLFPIHAFYTYILMYHKFELIPLLLELPYPRPKEVPRELSKKLPNKFLPDVVKITSDEQILIDRLISKLQVIAGKDHEVVADTITILQTWYKV